MPSRLNKLMLEELKKGFHDVDTCVFVDFTGLTGRKAAALRDRLREACGAGAAFTVVKNSLARRAVADSPGMSSLDDAALDALLAGPTAVAYGADDPALVARTLAEWGTKGKRLRFKGGLLSGSPMAAETVAELAKIPPKNVLMAQAVGTAAAPLTGLLAVAQGVLRKLVGLADAMAKQKDESSAG